MKTEVLELMVEGVRVRIDEHGRPLTVNTGLWLGGDAERIARLAMYAAEMRLRRSADQRRKVIDEKRTAKSAKERRENAAAHWSRQWLAAAHARHPGYGAERLMQEARKQVFLNRRGKPEFDRRDEITKYRAEQYLRIARSK